MLSNDFTLLEIKIFWFFAILISPIVFGATLGILIWWLGVKGLITFVIPLLSIPIQIILGSYIGAQLEKVNKHKDARLNTTTDFITSIKHIKSYAW